MIDDLTEAFLAADDLLKNAADAQWERPPYPVDPGGGRRSSIPDPTATIALDSKRLRLRASVLKAERAVRDAVEGIREANSALQKALQEWQQV